MIQEQLSSQQKAFNSISSEDQLTQIYCVESRRNKKNLFKVYKCACKKKHHSKNQMKKHKINCVIRNQVKKRVQKQFEKQYHLIEQKNRQTTINREQFDSLKKRLQILEHGDRFISTQCHNAYKKAKTIYERYSESISGIIINKLAQSLENAAKANIKVFQLENSIAASIMGKLQSLCFNDCVQQLSEKLAMAHKLLLEQSTHKKEKTRRYNERAYNFLAQFSQFELLTQVKVFDQLLRLDTTQRKNVVRYFSKIRKIDIFFSKYPPLPRLYSSVPRGLMLSKTTIEEAAKQVRSIFMNQDKELATDMWLVICLGLRFHDLKKIYFVIDGKGLVKFVRLKEEKNNNICERYIPTSLIQMAISGEVQFPSNQKRLRRAVRQCLSRFHSAYGFKHRALTAILTALHQSNPLARMHSRPQMTMNHYINKNDEVFLDNAFKIGINFIFNNEVADSILHRNLQLDLSTSQPRIKTLNSNVLGEITIQCQDIIIDRYSSSALDGNLEINSLQENRIDIKQQRHFFQDAVISKNHQIQMLSDKYSQIQEAVGNLDPQNLIVEATQLLVESVGDDPDDQLIIDKLSQVVGRQVHLYQFVQDELENHLVSSFPSQNDDIQIVISKSQQGFSLSTNNLSINSQQLNILRPRKSTYYKKSYSHRKFAPRCMQCKQKQIYSKIRSSDAGVQCIKCGWKEQHSGDLYPLKRNVQIESTNVDEVDGYECIKTLKMKNNLIETINNIYPGKFSPQTMYSKDFPSRITTYLKRASRLFSSELQKCKKKMENLPLQIRQSSVQGAGYGLFTTQPIRNESLILTYTGVVGTSYSIQDKQTNNSLFQAGWIHTNNNQNIGFEVLIDGELLVGPARFINSSYNFKSSNVKASSVVDNGEIIIYFYSTRDIQAYQQLFFFYGNKYWQESKKKPNEPKDSEQSESDN